MSDGTDRLQALIRKTDSKNAVDIIKEAIGDPQILVFSELYYSKNVQALKKAGSNPKAIATLELFAFNCYEDYTKNKEKYFELKPEEEKKLKILTFLSLCRESSVFFFFLVL
jgi:hypothetical protein